MSATFVRMTGSQKADEKEDFSTVKWNTLIETDATIDLLFLWRQTYTSYNKDGYEINKMDI